MGHGSLTGSPRYEALARAEKRRLRRWFSSPRELGPHSAKRTKNRLPCGAMNGGVTRTALRRSHARGVKAGAQCASLRRSTQLWCLQLWNDRTLPCSNAANTPYCATSLFQAACSALHGLLIKNKSPSHVQYKIVAHEPTADAPSPEPSLASMNPLLAIALRRPKYSSRASSSVSNSRAW